jgi:hypothetical protein
LRTLLIILAFTSLSCIEDHLAVDITTEVHRDGTCHRLVAYSLERFDTAKPTERLAIDPNDDPLTKLHRFPRGPAWTQRRDLLDLREVVTLEADLESPNSIGSDYFRVRKPKFPPARNQVDFAMDSLEGGDLYEFRETFRDPASPLRAARQLAKALERRDDAFAREFLSRIQGPRFGDVKRAYRDTFSLPILHATTALLARAAYGLRERRDLEAIFLRSRYEPDLSAALLALIPGGSNPEPVAKAVDSSLEALTPSIESEMSAAGLPMDAIFPETQETSYIHFTARLVMPVPITRANTCFNGDTASWEFEGDDLYERGFDMWARAVLSHP